MSILTDMYTYAPMEGAIVHSVTSEATNHPAEHAITPLEPNFAWEANQLSTQHQIVVDLGEIRECDGFSFIHHESEATTPVPLGVDISVEKSDDGVVYTSIADYMTSDADNSPSDLNDSDIRIKLRHFQNTVNTLGSHSGRYWRFTITGITGPFYYPPSDTRISMLWLFNFYQLDRGAGYPVNNTPVYPVTSITLPFGKTYHTGHSINPHTTFNHIWMVTETEYQVLCDVMRECNGMYRPFLLVENQDNRRLCKFSNDEIQEELLDVGLYRVTCQFVELPIVGKDKYH